MIVLAATGVFHHVSTLAEKNKVSSRIVVAFKEDFSHPYYYTTHNSLRNPAIQTRFFESHPLECIETPQIWLAKREKSCLYSLDTAEVIAAMIHQTAIRLKDIDSTGSNDPLDSLLKIFILCIAVEILQRVIHQCEVVLSIVASIWTFLSMKIPPTKTCEERRYLESIVIFGPWSVREKWKQDIDILFA